MAGLAIGALSLASAMNQARGQRRAARGTERAGELEGALYDQNAEFAERQADDAIARGHETEGRYRAGVRQVIGTQRAGYAAQGVDVGDGSAAEVQADTAYIGELDALTIRNNAKREAYGFKVDAWNSRNQGELARMSGRNQAASLRNQSYSTLLSGAAGFVGSYSSRLRAPKRSTGGAGGPNYGRPWDREWSNS